MCLRESDFHELPVPFRAVASDLVTGKSFEMCAGDLAEALRASMSAPGIFSPVTIDGHTLVDGGLGGNVPVETIRKMDVDIIIAVDVEFPLYEPEQLNSALDISAQMLTILIRNQTQEQLATLGPKDLLISPALGQFGSTNFGEIAETIEPGVRAAAGIGGTTASIHVGRRVLSATCGRSTCAHFIGARAYRFRACRQRRESRE